MKTFRTRLFTAVHMADKVVVASGFKSRSLERMLLAQPLDTLVKLHLSSGSVVSGRINERDNDSVIALYVQLDDRRIEHTLVPVSEIVALCTYTG